MSRVGQRPIALGWLLLAFLLPVGFPGPAPAARSPHYRVIGLGSLGGSRSWAYGLNDAGEVVGDAELADGTVHAFLWSSGLQDLGTLPGGTESHARDLNGRRQVVGFGPDEEARERALLWQSGTVQDLGTLGGETSRAEAINERGVIVGEADLAPSRRRPFIWRRGKMQGLTGREPLLPVDAIGVNDRGDVVGRAVKVTIDYADGAYHWDGRRFQSHGFSISATCRATGINASGAVVGYRHDYGGGEAWLWRGNRVQTLIQSNYERYGTGGASATAINDRGQVVGDVRLDDLHPERVFLWESGRLQYLDELIDPGSGWRLTHATAINNRGQIAGWGRFRGGPTTAVLLSPR